MLSVVFLAVNVFSSPNSAGVFSKLLSMCVLYVVRKLGVCTFCPPWCFKGFYLLLSFGELIAGSVVNGDHRDTEEDTGWAVHRSLSPKNICYSVCSHGSQTAPWNFSITYYQIPSKLTFVTMDSDLLALLTSELMPLSVGLFHLECHCESQQLQRQLGLSLFRWMRPLLGFHWGTASVAADQAPTSAPNRWNTMLIKSTQTGLQIHWYFSILSISQEHISKAILELV